MKCPKHLVEQVAKQQLTPDETGIVRLADDWLKMDSLLTRYKQALEGLTPGGSEYVNDPERCAQYVRDRFDSLHREIKRRAGLGK